MRPTTAYRLLDVTATRDLEMLLDWIGTAGYPLPDLSLVETVALL